MNRFQLSVILVLCLVFSAAAVSAQNEARWLVPANGDLVAESLTASPGLKAASVPRESVTFSRPLGADETLDLRAAPLRTESREYFVEVSAEDLENGVAIVTGGPGAVVRINPAPGEKAGPTIDPVTLTLADPTGKAWTSGAAMDLLVDADKLRASGAPFVEGTAAFRIRTDLGAGTFELRAENLDGGRYVVHVFDRNSPVALRLATLQADYLHGQNLRLEASLGAEGASEKARFDGFVTSPAGRAWPVTFERLASGAYGATLKLDGLETPAPGLWEAHVVAFSADKVGALRRSVRVPFQVAVPSARFDGAVAVSAEAELSLSFGVEAASASRYEVRGVLYGTDDTGALVPAALAHSAAWLEPGHGTVDLVFEPAHVEASGLQAPFEIRDLRLIDQGTMGLLHRQERGLVLSK